RTLEALQALRDVVVIHTARDDRDAIFGRELATMARQHAGLRLIAHRSGTHGRLAAATLPALVPDLASRTAYVCGPPGLIELVTTVAAAAGTTVHHERFVAARPIAANTNGAAGSAPVQIR